MSNKKALSRAVFATKAVPVDGVEGTVSVREMTLRERLDFSKRFKEAGTDGEAMEKANAWLIAKCFLLNGNAEYNAESESDIEEIIDSPGSIREALLKEIFAVSGITVQAGEQTEKNSETSPNA